MVTFHAVLLPLAVLLIGIAVCLPRRHYAVNQALATLGTLLALIAVLLVLVA